MAIEVSWRSVLCLGWFCDVWEMEGGERLDK